MNKLVKTTIKVYSITGDILNPKQYCNLVDWRLAYVERKNAFNMFCPLRNQFYIGDTFGCYIKE